MFLSFCCNIVLFDDTRSDSTQPCLYWFKFQFFSVRKEQHWQSHSIAQLYTLPLPHALLTLKLSVSGQVWSFFISRVVDWLITKTRLIDNQNPLPNNSEYAWRNGLSFQKLPKNSEYSCQTTESCCFGNGLSCLYQLRRARPPAPPHFKRRLMYGVSCTCTVLLRLCFALHYSALLLIVCH
jgi:hypothetical protein